MRICVVRGSRADAGLLQPIIDLLPEDTNVLNLFGAPFDGAFGHSKDMLEQWKPDVVLLLGDRYEILAAAIAAHLQRIPIAHIGGGDVSEGSYDNAMRDCISRMAEIHFVTSIDAKLRLQNHQIRFISNVHLVGSPGVDVIMRGEWNIGRPIAEPYVVVNYQAETIDGTIEWAAVMDAVGDREAVFMMPNPDAGSEKIRERIVDLAQRPRGVVFHESLPHAEYLNLIYHSEELIGNSSSLLYEAPFFDPPVKTRMIGRRQQGRVQPFGDGKASERIVSILKAWKP